MPACFSADAGGLLPPDRSLRRDRRHGRVGLGLAAAIAVEHAHLMHAGQRAGRAAGLLGMELADDVALRIVEQRNAGIAALLRAPMDLAVLRDIEIAGAGPAFPR